MSQTNPKPKSLRAITKECQQEDREARRNGGSSLKNDSDNPDVIELESDESEARTEPQRSKQKMTVESLLKLLAKQKAESAQKIAE